LDLGPLGSFQSPKKRKATGLTKKAIAFLESPFSDGSDSEE
jgi:hypothetical protein